MYAIDVTRPGQPAAVFVVQAIGMAVVTADERWPAVEVWSAAGGGIYTKAVYRWQATRRQFCAATVDEFEDHGDEQPANGVVLIPGNDRPVRYARSRPFGCE